jgi:biopolymer transport protein ExbB
MVGLLIITMKRQLKTLASYLLIIAFVAIALPVRASAWWNSDWSARKKINLDLTSKGVPITDNVGDTAVLVRLYDSNFTFSISKPDGSDLRFIADDDKTELPYHIEKFDTLLNAGFVWVKIPALKANAVTSFWMYYGNTSEKLDKAENYKATYDATTVLVYHFNEHGQQAFDFSGLSNIAKNAASFTDGSMIGTGSRFDGQKSVEIPASASLNWTESAPFTLSVWVKPTKFESNQEIISRRSGIAKFAVGLDQGKAYIEVINSGRTTRATATTGIPIGSWHNIAVSSDGSKQKLYVDGVNVSSLDVSTPSITGSVFISNTGFIGELDELTISSIARSADYIKFQALEQAGDTASKLVSIGEDEVATNWLSWMNSGTFGILIHSLTLDGWVVIGILSIMFMISWYIMITKAGSLNAGGKANEIFMKHWHHLANDLTLLDSDDVDKIRSLGGRMTKEDQRLMKDAGVYRIYHIGVEEIRRRQSAELKNNSKVLSARSIQAIRSSLDSGLVRETQKLNSGLVLLTIAISGGPFLGLLGTVVGVMITFAAIAAAGDVNVNSIAPGIAGALVATVAGLAVAIPALFGYNYLLARVKDATSNMHVFVDEFVTRMAEYYEEPSNK